MRKILITCLFLATVASCGSDDSDNGDDGIIFFSIEDDKALGAELKAEIFANPQDYPILDTNQYAQAYAYLNNLKNQILNSGEIQYKEEFAWEIYMIENDSVLNAFASPGGYIFVYTGLINFLDKEDDLVGVLGHEIAHADERHSVQQLQAQYGISLLLSVALGKAPGRLTEILAQLAGQVAGLKFSRKHETEADLKSVEYLAVLPHKCDAAASFFKKIEDSGTPVFLSTHPSPDDRVAQIEAKALEIGCDTTYYAPATYDTQFRDLLP